MEDSFFNLSVAMGMVKAAVAAVATNWHVRWAASAKPTQDSLLCDLEGLETQRSAEFRSPPPGTVTRTVGAKYNRDLDIAAIAKLVRADIAAGVKSGALPAGLKCSVKIERFSGGSSLYCAVTAWPGGRIHNAARLAFDRDNPHARYDSYTPKIQTPEADALEAKLTAIVKAYQHSDVDSMADYYNVSFYEHVGFDRELASADSAAVLAELERATMALATAEAAKHGIVPIPPPPGFHTVTSANEHECLSPSDGRIGWPRNHSPLVHVSGCSHDALVRTGRLRIVAG